MVLPTQPPTPFFLAKFPPILIKTIAIVAMAPKRMTQIRDVGDLSKFSQCLTIPVQHSPPRADPAFTCAGISHGKLEGQKKEEERK